MGWISLLLLFMGVRGFSATDTIMQGPTSVKSSWSVSSYKHTHTSVNKFCIFTTTYIYKSQHYLCV